MTPLPTGKPILPISPTEDEHGNPTTCRACGRVAIGVRSLIKSPRREHSRKPDEVYGRVESLVADPYIELFARQAWPGWTAWGNEAGKFETERMVA